MRSAFYLAFAYMRYHRVQTVALVAALALIVVAPVAIRIVLSASEAALRSRAEATPLVIGARGGALDVILNTLYFTEGRQPGVPHAAADAVRASGLAAAIPLHVRFQARGVPIVGTTLDYFDFRGLEVAHGRNIAVLGEAVLGAGAARELRLRPDDVVLSDPTTLFDLAGAYPLELQVVGVLAESHGADDDAIFVDLKSTWLIEGIGHGHDEVAADPNPAIARDKGNLVASPAITQFTRITPENIDSFHVHGAPGSFPLSGVIAVPRDARAGTILRGRYLEGDNPYQIIDPSEVIERLLGTLFRIGRILDIVAAAAGLAAGLAIAVAISLSLKLRGPEMRTMFQLGAHRLTTIRMLAAQIGLMLLASLMLAAVALVPTVFYAREIALILITAQP